jgi:hypothetical protein
MSDNRASLIKIAAECHRAKWQFDLSEDYRPTAKVSRAMIENAFNELHRIGDMALKLSSPTLSLHTAVANDALVKALEQLLSLMATMDGCDCDSCRPIQQARAALSAVTLHVRKP